MATATRDEARFVKTNQGITVQEALDQFQTEFGEIRKTVNSLTPEMFGASGDGVSDDTAAIQAAIQYANDNRKNIITGMGSYRITSPLKIDNFSFALQINLAMLLPDATTWPAPNSWKDATPAFLIGSESNGSQVGLNINIGFFHGRDKATMFRLKEFGCGGCHFHVNRAQNFVIGFQCTESTRIGSSSNRITGNYWLQGITAIRVARSPGFVVEGTKFSVQFVTNMRYGGAQFFGGSQYSSIFNSDMDFSGQWLTELIVDKLPASNIRGQSVSSHGKLYEVVDYYQYPKGQFNILVIEDHNTINGNTDFKAGDKAVVANIEYNVERTRTCTSKQFYFDIIHGFQGEPFAKFRAECGYLGGIVGGVLFDSEVSSSNSYSSFTMNLKGLSVVHNGNFMRLSDRYLQGQLFHMWPTRMDTFKHIHIGDFRLYGTNVQTTLEQGVYKVLRTFAFQGDGDVTNTKEVWEVTISGPTDINTVGGHALIYVSPSKIEVLSQSLHNMELNANGLQLRARQNTNTSMPITFMLQRRL